MKISLIFDLDNTLIHCSEYYAEAKHKFADMMALDTEISQASALRILQLIDLEHINMRGVVRERHAQSFVAACAAIEVLMGKEHSKTRAKKAWRMGDSVFKAPYPLYDGVYEALEEIKGRGYNMFLCTKGDSKVQLKKIKNNKLHKIFPDGHVYIDSSKGVEHFRKIMKEHGLDPKLTIGIGDSLRDDISSGKTAGMVTIHVTGQQIDWGYEDQEVVPDASIHSIVDLPELLKQINHAS